MVKRNSQLSLWRKIKIFLILILGLSFFLGRSSASNEQHGGWKQLEQGLYLQDFVFPVRSYLGDSKLTVLKIDPAHFELDIYCQDKFNGKKRAPGMWAEDFQLAAVINAGMYAKDYITSVGFLKSGDYVNNSRLQDNFNALLACGPKSENIPPVQIIDLQCENFSQWRDSYHSFLQSIRMINCQQENVWQPQPQKWSIAALGMDKSGYLLMMHCRSPYSVHNFIQLILELPLDLYNAMYLEGGSQASLYISSGGMTRELRGVSEAELLLGETDLPAWPIPNVIGIKRIE